MTFLTIDNASQGEYRELRSRFMSFAFPLHDAQEVKPIVDKLKKEYFDARHHCYAWKTGVGNQVLTRTNDDREPSHTAGEPILAAIDSADITDVLIVVVRYFGGVKLGASNLSKAYRAAAAAAIDNAVKVQKVQTEDIVFSFDYSVMAQVNKFLKENNFTKDTYRYTDANVICLKVETEKAEEFKAKLSSVYGITVME
ncbi:MAG: YigZ family protein [Bacteroidales bacterium]|nr:YigZ family protein [Bacteroidales bacterium]